MPRRSSPRAAIPTVLVLVLALCLLAVPAAALAETQVPSSYLIEGVPQYQQLQAHGCGAAAEQMVLDHWGPFVAQQSVYDAARTWKGTSLPDLARAGQLSSGSLMRGDFFPSAVTWGYPSRALGYGAFYYAASAPWLDQLKAVVAQGYPVICLTDWLPGVYGPHYRVVVGYDDAKGVVILRDPWGREFKGDMDYQGAMNQKAAYDRQGQFAGWEWSYADFQAVWSLSTNAWGVSGLNYGAVLIAPWKVTVQAPEHAIEPGATFPVHVSMTYPCPAPFGSIGFPVFTAESVWVDFSLPEGFTTAGDVISLGVPLPAGATDGVTILVTAGDDPGPFTISAEASGKVTGELSWWRKYPGYSYADRIGGQGSATVTVAD